MNATSYQNGIHRELKDGRFGPYWAMVIRAETAPMWPSMAGDTGEPEEIPEKFAPSIAICRQLEDGFKVAIGDYQPWFPRALDRDIFEHTPYGLDFPAWPHEQISTCPRHLTVKWLAQKAQCSPREAAQLADALSILDASEPVAREVCRWARARGIAATVDYLFVFCLAVAEVEQLPADDALAETAESVPETIAYHRIGAYQEGPDWLESSPLWFQQLIANIRQEKDLEALKAICKIVYDQLQGDYKAVFLSYYNARINYLEAKAATCLSRPARAYLARIEKATSLRDLGVFGLYLHKAQHGKVKAPTLKPVEWSLIWRAYQAKKATFQS